MFKKEINPSINCLITVSEAPNFSLHLMSFIMYKTVQALFNDAQRINTAKYILSISIFENYRHQPYSRLIHTYENHRIAMKTISYLVDD